MTTNSIMIPIFLIGLSTGLLVTLIVIARPILHRYAAANWSYMVWWTALAPVSVAILPVSFSNTIYQKNIAAVPFDFAVGTPGESHQSILLFVLAFIWLVGAAVQLLLMWNQSRKLYSATHGELQLPPKSIQRQFESICERNGVFPPPRIRVLPLLNAPALLGVFNPTIVIPDAFATRFSTSEQHLTLMHELVHYRRHDACWNLLFRVARCFFWFLPFVKKAERCFRADQERACDYAVLCDEPKKSRADYGTAILKTASAGAASSKLTAFLNTKSDILVRTADLQRHRRSRPGSMVGALAIAALLFVAGIATPHFESDPAPLTTSNPWCSVYSGLGR